MSGAEYLLTLLGIMAGFVYTAGYRFLKELIENTANRRDYRIQGYYIFSDFTLDYIYGGSTYCLLLIFFSLIFDFREDKVKLLWMFIWIVWIVLFLLILILWFLKKILRNARTLIRDSCTRFCLSCLLIVIIVLIEFWYMYHGFTEYKCINDIRPLIWIIFPKLFALFSWLIFGLIWTPFSAYAEHRGLLK